jgi:hypothetical protein
VSTFEKLHEAVDLKREILILAAEAKLALLENKTNVALEKLNKITALLD